MIANIGIGSATNMFDLYMLPAEQGDCIWIEYGPPAARHRILYDCGTKDTWPMLKERIEKLDPKDRKFALLVISHIDKDHIGGAIDLLRHRKSLGVTFGEIWFNDYRHVSDMLGFPEAIVLAKELDKPDLKPCWNRAYVGAAVVHKAGDRRPPPEFGGMKLMLLSPTPTLLSKLAEGWEDALAKFKAKPGHSAGADDMLGGKSTARAQPAGFGSDNSKPNGSSIAVVAEYDGKRVLLAGDAYASTLCAGLKRLSGTGPYRIDAYKVSHHGSRANVSKALLNAMTCENFLFSSNGLHGMRPHIETLGLIRDHTKASAFYFNYRAPHVETWVSGAITHSNPCDIHFTEDADYRIDINTVALGKSA